MVTVGFGMENISGLQYGVGCGSSHATDFSSSTHVIESDRAMVSELTSVAVSGTYNKNEWLVPTTMGSIVVFYTFVAVLGAIMDRRERRKRQTYRLRRFVTTGSLKPWQGLEGKNESLFARLRRGFATDHAWASILYSPLGATILMSRTQRAVMSVAELICGLAVAAFFYGREQEVSADSLTTVDWRKCVQCLRL